MFKGDKGGRAGSVDLLLVKNRHLSPDFAGAGEVHTGNWIKLVKRRQGWGKSPGRASPTCRAGLQTVRWGRLLTISDVKEQARAPAVGFPGKLGRGSSFGPATDRWRSAAGLPGRGARTVQPVRDSATTARALRYGYTTGGGESYSYRRNLRVNF